MVEICILVNMGEIPKILLGDGHSIIGSIDINKIYSQHMLEKILDRPHYNEQRNYDKKSHGVFREINKHFLCQSFKYEISSGSICD